MTIKSSHLYVSTALLLLLIIGLLFGYNGYKKPDVQEKVITINTISYTSGKQSFHTPTYALPNGLVLFDTHIWPTEYDYNTDDSLQKYVSRDITLNNTEYTPKDLVTISNKRLILASPSMKLRDIAHSKLNDMAQEFYNIFWDKLVIVSAYRSYDYQKKLKKWCSDTLCALPGRSEHQLGLAIDIFAATTAWDFLSKAEFKKYYEWLAINAHRYGWHNTYQKWVDIDTYQVEPRHRRYLGRELATELFERKMTLGEWYKEKSK
jgi:D-alanyl-D-alanine carboxypeptidase